MPTTKKKTYSIPMWLSELRYELTTRDLVKWAIDELKVLRGVIAGTPINDERSYSRSFTELNKTWYNYIHAKLKEYDFVNGEPKENTWEKRPKACFWLEVYKSSPDHYRPFYDHHCSSRCRQEQMLNLLDDTIKLLTEAING